MPENEHGPFDAERQALATLAAARVDAVRDTHPDDRRAASRERVKLLTEACEAAGVPLGDYDLRLFNWLSEWETGQCVALRGIIRRAFEAGRAAGPDGAVTEWGFRYEGEGSPATVMPYPLAAVQQMCREFPELSPGVTRTVVARQTGPWLEAEVPASVACRHCLGTIVPCDPPHGHPACLGWKHAAWLKMGPIGAHYCEGRSVNPSGEPREDGEP